METILEAMISDLGRETEITKRVLDRVPEDKLDWRPHAKSMTLGQLAFHVATIPAGLSQLAAFDVFDAANANFEPPQPSSKTEVLAALDGGIEKAASFLKTLNMTSADEPWRLTLSRRDVFAMPRNNVTQSSF